MKIYINNRYDGMASLAASGQGSLILQASEVEDKIVMSLGNDFDRLPLKKLEVVPDGEDKSV